MANFRGPSFVIRGRLPSLRKAGWLPAFYPGPSDGVARPGHFALILSALLSVCVIALSAGIMWHERETKLARVQRDLANLSHALAENVARTLETIDLSLAAGLGQLRDAQGLPGAAELSQRALRAHADAIPAVSAIALFGADGVRRASSMTGDSELPFALPSSAVIAAQQTGAAQAVSVSARRIGAEGAWKIIVSRAAGGPEAEFRGVIAASVDARRLAESYKAIDLGASSSVALYSSKGVLLAAHPWPNDMIGKTHSEAAIHARAGEHAATVHERVSPFNNQVALAADISIRGYPLLLSLTVDRDTVLAPWKRETLIVGSAAVMIAALALALGALVERYVRRREESVARLRENQAELSEAQRIAQLGRFSVDGATGTIQWSAQAAQLLGAPQVLSSTLASLVEHVLEEDRERLSCAWQRLLGASNSDDIEFRVAARTGQVRWLRARAEMQPARAG